MSKRKLSAFLVVMVCILLGWYTLGLPLIHRMVSPYFSVNYTVHSVDNFYDEELQAYSGEIFSDSLLSYSVKDRVGDVLLIKNSFEVFTLAGDPIISLSRNYAIDSYTGEHVPELGDQERTGYLFAPSHLSLGEPFTYWHINYNAPAKMEYVGTEEIQGVEVYRYFSEYEGEAIEQTAQQTHLPGVPEERRVLLEPKLTLWVEPETGMLVSYKDETIAYYYDLESGEKLFPWNKFSNTFTDETISQIIEQIHARQFMFLLQNWIVPAFLFSITVTTALLLVLPKESLLQIKSLVTSIYWQQLLASIVGIGGVVVLFGWVFNIELLKSVVSGLVSMKVSTALSFVFSGVIVFLGGNSKLRYSTAASVLLPIATLLITIIMGTLFITSLAEVSFGFDSVLVVEKTHEALFSSQPGIPSQGTIVAFFLIAIVGIFSLLHMNNHYKSLLYRAIGMSIISIASVALAGYVMDIPVLYYYVEDQSTAMAVHTSIFFRVFPRIAA